MNKKLTVVIFLLITIIITLNGCSAIGIDNSELMRPPKATGDKAEIQKVIDEVAGDDSYVLKYPQSGEYRSAIIMKDLDNNGTPEAITFYQKKQDKNIITNVLIIAENNNKWEAVGNFESPIPEVNKIEFADITGSGHLNIVVGWGSAGSTTNQLTIYSYNQNKTNQTIVKDTCTNFTTGKFTGETADELLLFSLSTGEAEANVKLMRWKDDSKNLSVLSQAPIDPNITRLTQLKSGKISATQYAAYADGITSVGDYNTQVIYYDKEESKLKNTLYNSKEKNITTRQIPVFSTLLTESSVAVPTCRLLQHDNINDETTVPTEVQWNLYNQSTEQLEHKSSMIMDLTYNFSIDLPDRWSYDNVTALSSKENKTLTFYKWNEADKKIGLGKGKKLLTIKIFTEEEWLTEDKSKNYTILEKTPKYVYTYFLNDIEDDLQLSEEEVLDSFSLLTGNYSTFSTTLKQDNISSNNSLNLN